MKQRNSSGGNLQKNLFLAAELSDSTGPYEVYDGETAVAGAFEEASTQKIFEEKALLA